MKTVRDLMTTDVVWVSPSARVKSAVLLMKGHDIGALPVLHADEAVVGLVTQHCLLGEPEDTAVTEVMEKDYLVLGPDTDVYTAADEMNHAHASHLLVMEEGRLVGIVSHADLMPELGKNFDPLTGLQWSDSFREWAMNALKRGIEISVIFFDLDQFGLFNKKHGHVVGDKVLKEVSEVLKTGIDPDLDFACRYGGDEFVIVSSRKAEDAIALADTLQERISRVRIPEMADSVSGSYGMSGGRRSREREDIHYAATIDDLITRASKDCIAKKPGRTEAAVPAQATQPEQPAHETTPAHVPGERLKIRTVTISTTDVDATVSVTLERGDCEFRREASGYVVGGNNILRLVAEAAAGAACKSMAPGHGVVVEGVSAHNIGTDDDIITVAATFISPKYSTRHVGSAVVKRGDQYRTTAAAVLAAVNRLVEAAPRAEREELEPAEPETPEHTG